MGFTTGFAINENLFFLLFQNLRFLGVNLVLEPFLMATCIIYVVFLKKEKCMVAPYPMVQNIKWYLENKTTISFLETSVLV